MKLSGVTTMAATLVSKQKRHRPDGNGCFVVPITSLAPAPFHVLKDIKAVIQPSGDEYMATFFDANINTAGCNEQEAIDNLKDLLVSRFLYLSGQPSEQLAPPLARQIAVLREFIRRSE
jgi:hypothetical protein